VKRDDTLKLAGEVRDLQIVDSEGLHCGICDDIEFRGKPGEPLTVAGLLVGPGAYKGRLPHWAFALARAIAGDRIVRVPWSAIDRITGRIFLNATGESLGLRRSEDRLQKRFGKVPLP
jgi:sporulation protein YlmC with PRC-barrel domain